MTVFARDHVERGFFRPDAGAAVRASKIFFRNVQRAESLGGNSRRLDEVPAPVLLRVADGEQRLYLPSSAFGLNANRAAVNDILMAANGGTVIAGFIQ